MADTNKPGRILTTRGMKIASILDAADSRRDLIRCLAEAIAHLESRIDKVELLGEKFKYMEND